VSLAYDPNGRLWQLAGPLGVTRFEYDPGSGVRGRLDKLLEEFNTAGNWVRLYAWGPSSDEPLIWYEGTGGPVRRFLHADHQGSVIAVTDDAGNPIAINGYDAWGIPNATNGGRFEYTGQAWLPELGLYYYKARIYSPTLGRFLQSDPVGYKDQVNLYAYVANDPVDHTDPDGKSLWIKGPKEYQQAVKAQIKVLQSRPAGAALINRLVFSKNVHIIVPGKPDDPDGAATDPQGPSRNGIGDGSKIFFDPTNDRMMTPDDAGNFTAAPFVKLGHELGHAEAMDRGVQSLQYKPMTPGTTPPSERQSMAWERAIRKEHGLPDRSSYYPPDPK
jgi:RHS repeat-associated protein